MTNEAVKILCFALAEYARIEGMKAANQARLSRGEALAHNEEAFGYSANALDQLAHEVINS